MGVNLKVERKYANEPSENVIKRFIRKFRKKRLLKEFTKKLYYVKPSKERHDLERKRKYINDKKVQEQKLKEQEELSKA